MTEYIDEQELFQLKYADDDDDNDDESYYTLQPDEPKPGGIIDRFEQEVASVKNTSTSRHLTLHDTDHLIRNKSPARACIIEILSLAQIQEKYK
jgi:hypothetical protein